MNRRDFVTQGSMVLASSGLRKAQGSTLLSKPTLATNLIPISRKGQFDVARNCAVYQSDAADDDHTAHLITDGSDLTYWKSSGAGEHSVEVDLGSARSLHRIEIKWGKLAPERLKIEASREAQGDWTLLHEFHLDEQITFETALDARSVRRVRLTGDSLTHAFSIVRLHLWGEAHDVIRDRIPMASPAGIELDSGWCLINQRFVESAPKEISSPRFRSEGWLPGVVPGTVLTSYLAAKAIPDPFFGDQQTQISEDFFTRGNFWYRNIFQIASECRDRRLWIIFEGINWKADIYFNGQMIGRIDGAFTRTRFEITEQAVCGGRNCVAVLIHHVDHPGPVQHKRLSQIYRNGSQLGEDSPTFLSSSGWNWLPTIRGRNIGIWNHVRFETTADGRLIDPWVVSVLPLEDHSSADLVVRTEIRNDAAQEAHFELTLQYKEHSFTKRIEVGSRETRELVIDKTQWPHLALSDPELWWPNGYGKQRLHSLRLTLQQDGKLSDQKNVVFGIRRLDYEVRNGILNIVVNGQKVPCCGGNWGMDDGMLSCDQAGYDLRVRMHRDMNMVMIRNWVGMVGREEFYDACDRHGILVWDDFWLANPVDGSEPTDEAMFMSNAVDKIRRVRSHPSLALYCGRNEGYPPATLDKAMREAVHQYDPLRYYIPHSAAGVVSGLGPYFNAEPEWYFANRGKTFHSEQGIVALPSAEGIRAMMPLKDTWPISDMWAVHDYQHPRSSDNTKRIHDRYGESKSLDDYCRKAQMVNLETAKAMFECLRSQQGAGLLVWMSQAAWPALICQLYDYYFEQTAAYFGAKTACRSLHILWDQSSNDVRVANNTRRRQQGLVAEATVYDLGGRQVRTKSAPLSVEAASTTICFPLEQRPSLQCQFLKLKLKSGTRVSGENFYWLHSADGDCLSLNDLPKVRLTAETQLRKRENGKLLVVSIFNSTLHVAVAVRLRVMDARTGQLVLPTMYEDNYFSLLPTERRSILVELPTELPGRRYRLGLSGWNIEPSIFNLN